VDRAVSVATLSALVAGAAATSAAVDRAVLPIREALGFLPALHVRRPFEAPLLHGVQPLPGWLLAAPRQSGKHLLLSEDGRTLLGIADVEGGSGVRLAIVFAAPIPATETDPR
jgi:hypothetical protein